jgi:hypothetical protein
VTPCNDVLDTNVSDEFAASIFMVSAAYREYFHLGESRFSVRVVIFGTPLTVYQYLIKSSRAISRVRCT